MIGKIKDIGKSTIIWAVVFNMLFILFGACDVPHKKLYTVGVLSNAGYHVPAIEGFKEGMAALGYIEGKDIRYIYNGVIKPDDQSIDAEIKKFLDQGIDMFFTVGSLAPLRVKKAVEGTDMPVLMAACGRPVERGMVKDMVHPGGNLTGVQILDGRPKALEYLITLTPGAKKIYLPYNPYGAISFVEGLSKLKEVASKMGIELVLHEIQSYQEAVKTIEDRKDIDAVFRLNTPGMDFRDSEIGPAAIKRGIPICSGGPPYEYDLVSFSFDYFDTGKRAAQQAQQIIRGAKPGDLPIETAEVYLTINLKVAEKLGIKIPDSFLYQAKTVIR